jgi:tetratricopeptide (TPR) repeat protein
MKNKLLFYIFITSFSYNSFAQNNKIAAVKNKIKTVPKSYIVPDSTRTVKSYHVEEKIKMNFGGYTVIYNVSDSSLINSTDLGPNNTRVITQRFAKPEQLMDSLKPIVNPSNLKTTDSLNKQGGYANVVMIKTYERVAEKGYKSVDIFQKLGNAFYFNDELNKAAKWYAELFAITTDLEPEYYYRYSASLKAIGENEKANEMLAKFNQLSGNIGSK